MDYYYRPDSIRDACEYLEEHEDAEVIAGGQTLTLLLRQGLVSPSTLVDVGDLDDMIGVIEDDDSVHIGAATTYADLRRSSVVQEAFPSLEMAISEVAGPQVRHNGTLGGGLCYGDPALDTPPVLLTLDASVTLQSVNGERTLLLDEFFTGYYDTALEPGELLVSVDVPRLPSESWGTYLAMAPRQGDYAIAGVAIRLTFDDQKVETARIGLTNAGDTPMRSTDAEAVLEGSTVDEGSINKAVDSVQESLDVLGDEMTSEWYKETVFRRLAGQALRDVDTARGEAAA